MFLHDANFRLMRANRAYANLAGMKFKEFIGKPYYEVFPKRDGPLSGCLNALERESPQIAELEEVLLDDGTTFLSRSFAVNDADGNYKHSMHIMEDITERKHTQLSLLTLNRTLKTLSMGNQTLVKATDEMQLLEDMCEVSIMHGGYLLAWVGYARDDAEKSIEIMAQNGVDEGFLEDSQFSWDASEERGNRPAGLAIRSGKTHISQDILGDANMSRWYEAARKISYASTIALPLRDNDKTFGVLVLYSDKINVFNDQEVALLEEMVGDLAYGVVSLRIKAAHTQHEQTIHTSLRKTQAAFSTMMEASDPYTAGHLRRAAKLAEAIARNMKLSDSQCEGMFLAGMVFDIGKIYLPAEILSRPKKLTGLELEYIQTHAQAGYDFLKDIPFPWPLAQAVLQHHERLDGSGYPSGLQDEQIILEARVLAVVDVVEAMSSHRPYRPSLGMDAALDEIERGRGVRYDAAVVDACLKVIREEGFEFK